MESRAYRAVVLALYQLSILVGIVMLPLAYVTRRLGVPLPIDRLVTRLRLAYERADNSS